MFTDKQLLETICKAQSEISMHKDTQKAFELLLDAFLSLTESAFGVIGEIIEDEGRPFLKARALSNLAWDEEAKKLYRQHLKDGMEFRNHELIFNRIIESGETVISNDIESLGKLFKLPDGHPPIESFLGIPFFAEGRMLGIAAAANRKDGYDEEIIRRLKPFISTLATILNTLHYEASLKESEARGRAVVDSALEAIITADKEGVIEEVNPATTMMFGYRKKEFIGRNVTMLMPEPHRSRHRDYIKRYLETGESKVVGKGLEVVGKRKDGKEIQLELAVNHVTVSGRDLFTGIFRDITERKLAEQKMLENEKRLRLILETSLDGFFITTFEGKFIDANESYCQMVGYGLEELKQFHIPDIEAAETPEETKAHIETLIREGQDRFMTRHRTKTGEIIDIDLSVTSIPTDGGQFVCFCRDVSEMRETEEKLSRLTKRLELATESAGIGVWDYDLVNGELIWDKRMYDLYGLPSDGFQGAYETWIQGLHPEDRERSEHAVQDAITGKNKFHTTFRIIRADGEIRHIEALASILRDEDAAPLNMIGINWDVTDRIENESKLRTLNEELTRRIRELDRINQENVLLNEMNSFLQSAQKIDEIIETLLKFTKRLFPEESLAVYLLQDGSILEQILQRDADDMEQIFKMEDCWALRRGEVHFVSDVEEGMVCPHFTNIQFHCSYCVPILTQDGMAGLVTMFRRQMKDDEKEAMDYDKMKRNLSVLDSFADRVGTALANLRLRQTLREESIQDPLTKLFNRRYMENALNWELRRAGRNGGNVSAILMDIDYFKNFNDTYGHDAGDIVLVEVASMLKSLTREEDIACRYGGEEFLVLLPTASKENAVGRAETMREEIRKRNLSYDGQELERVTMSFGVATFPEDANNGAKLLTLADKALYRAKENGRNRVEKA